MQQKENVVIGGISRNEQCIIDRIKVQLKLLMIRRDELLVMWEEQTGKGKFTKDLNEWRINFNRIEIGKSKRYKFEERFYELGVYLLAKLSKERRKELLKKPRSIRQQFLRLDHIMFTIMQVTLKR